MKISHNDLKLAYKSSIQNHIPSSRKGCPSAESILFIFEKSLSAKKKEKVIDHVVKCAYCFREFEFLLSLAREENMATKEISDFLGKIRQDETPSGKKCKIRTIISSLVPQRRPLWKLAVISMALLIITGLSLISIRSTHEPARDEERGRLREQVNLISPVQGQAGTLPLIFRWKKVREAEFYQLEIFNESLLPIWRSSQIAGIFYELPPEVAAMIEGSKDYFWMITAFFPNGVKKESPLERFILTK